MKILILCTGNSCRSQMAHGFMKSFAPDWQIFSGGTKPEKQVNPNAIRVMKELNIDISSHTPHHVNEYIGENWDYVITVCGGAKEICPVFIGNVKNRLHIGFEDPADARGEDDFVHNEYRRIRDEIKNEFELFYKSIK